LLTNKLEAEKALLCSILVDPKVLNEVVEHVNHPEMFHNPLCKKIFQAVLTLHDKNEAIDFVTVANEIGEQYAVEVAKLSDVIATSYNAVSYAVQVKEQYILRELQKACRSGLEMIEKREKPVEEIISTIETEINKASKGLVSNYVTPLGELVYQRFCKYYDTTEETIIKTGFIDFDNLIDGFNAGENIIIGARPSMGKTAFALNIARNVAGKGIPVLFFSLEMGKERLTDRLFCMEANVRLKAFRRRMLGEEDQRKLSLAMESLSKLPIEIIDGSKNTSQIRSMISKYIKNNQKMIVFIDFLTLITDYPNLEDHRRYGAIAQNLQRMAIEFNIPIVTLAQLSRKVEERKDKRPVLSDLRESGKIEEAADKVIFLYREEYYTGENKGITEVITAKNRDGEIGTIELCWIPEVMQFKNIATQR